ncbi:MAG: zinc ribbon domain-containing protein [Acidimicrobiaceae bacterium]|nr:zinc ribbon domain-containing protein [Acidimicrobiaceae bacterium]
MADSIQTERDNSPDTEHKPAESDLSDAELLELFAGHGVYRDNAVQYRGRLAGQLLINRCADCDRYHQPPRPMCPSCWSFDVVPTPVSGRGTIHLLMHLHAGPPADGVDYQNEGHPVVVVELEEQDHLRVTGTIHSFGNREPSIGDAVELEYLYRGGAPIVAFRPSTHQPSQPSQPSQRSNS